VHVITPDDADTTLSPDEVAERVWAVGGYDSEGHELSFAHAH
jgi:hypothetical protein